MALALQPRRHVSYPSPEFPGPPTIGLSIPDTWLTIGPDAYLQPDRKVDLAVCAPSPVDGVTPSIAATVIRTLPAEDPERLLTDLVADDVAQVPGSELVVSRYQTRPRPTACCVSRSRRPGKLMEHLQILTYVHDERLAHLVHLTGVYAADSEAGRAAVYDILGPVGAER
ncbi:MAG: hypothetical protein AAGE88_10985 [Actinomycetota bacterium]